MENFDQSKNQEKFKITALEKIETLINENLDEMYKIMLENDNVKNSGLKPTKKQFREYCEYFKKGLEYTSQEYGKDALPENLTFYTEEMRTGEIIDNDFIGYMPENDNLGVSFLHIANQCTRYDKPHLLFKDSHLPQGYGVTGEDYTVLQVIEESFHKYQVKKLGLKPENTMRNIDHPIENQIIQVFQKAVRDLNIKLYQLDTSGLSQAIKKYL